MLKKDIDTGLFWFIEPMVEQLKEFIEIEESRPIKAGPLVTL